ncbi:hypothetical protein ALT1644_520005 [Alteromonas macleodii]
MKSTSAQKLFKIPSTCSPQFLIVRALLYISEVTTAFTTISSHRFTPGYLF